MTPPKVSETTKEVEFLGRRDAFHVPGILVKSHQPMFPGDRVVFTDDALTSVRDESGNEKTQAIVDPFLPAGVVSPGTLFWVFPVPGSTGPVRHHFDVDIDPATHEEPVDDDDDSCRGCYGYDDDDIDDDDTCKGCYE